DQQPRTTIGERVDEWFGTLGRIVVELGARTIDVAGVKKSRQSIVDAIEGAGSQRGDVGRSQETVMREIANDLHVVIGDAESRRFRRTAKPRATYRFLSCQFDHDTIIAINRSPSHGRDA